MSQTKRVSEFDEVGMTFGLSAAGEQCFVCGELLTDPAIMWQGGNGQRIYLHADCTSTLCQGLWKDVRTHQVIRGAR